MSAASSVYDSVAFQREFLGRDLWAKQQEMLRAIETNRSVSVKGCHGSGKTFAAAGLIPDELLSNDESIVITVAPTLRQVKNLWSEIESAIQALPWQVPERTTTGWEISEKCKAIGFSSSKGVNAQGYHGKRVLILADEAIGIQGDLWDAIEGIRSAGDVRIVKLCNPTVPSGPVFEDFTRRRGQPGHSCITISAFDTPNLAGLTLESLLELPEEELDYAPYPHLTRRRWVKEMYQKWGPKNPRFEARVLGEFPTQSDYAVFTLEWIERAKREPTTQELARASDKLLQIGIDVAGAGDDETAACARMNGIIVARAAWPDKDPRGHVAQWMWRLKERGYQIQHVVVDIVGIGYNFALHLADLGFPVWGFNAQKSALDPEKFVNSKSESYFRLRDMYQADYICHMPDALDDECEAQLCSIEYRETSRGLIEIEPKDDARKRGVQSPDRAEAEIMAFCRVVPREQTITYTQPVPA